MTTREVMNALPENIRNNIERFKADYNRADLNMKERDKIRTGILFYCRALRDTGVITDPAHRQIYVYATL